MDYTKIKLDFNIQLVSPADLLLPENLDSIKYIAYNLIESLDWDGMLFFAESLEKSLSEITPTSNQDNYIYTILAYWVLRLRLFSYGSLRSNQKADLFKKSLVPMLSMGLDPKRAVFKFLDIFDSPDIITQETTDLLSDLKNNQEYLGDTKNFLTAEFRPTVSNWLKEYQTVLVSGGLRIEAGAFHIVKFMDTSKYVKYLRSDEKEILRDVLDLYNSLLNPITYVAEKTSVQPTSYIKSQKLELPQEILQPAPLKLPPVVPAPRNAPEVRGMEEVRQNPNSKFQIINGETGGAGISNGKLQIPNVGQNQKVGGAGLAENQGDRTNKASGVNNTEEGNKQPSAVPPMQAGLRMSPTENYQMPPRAIPKPVENTQEKIDKKLEELEKRVDGKTINN